MQSLAGSVGGGGKNAVHDVALVKFLMMVVKNSKGSSYLPLGDYTNVRDGSVSVAIRAFQQDTLLVDAVSGKPKPGVLPGLVEPGGATWAKLVAAVPDAYKTVRTTEGVTLVYFPMSPSALASAKGEIQAGGLKTEFQVKVTNLLDKFYAKSGIVVSANPNGLRRTFEQQVEMTYKSSEASPGETIHNYGYAVDLGFTGLSYVSSTGATQTVDAHDRGFNKWPRIKEQIFAARNAIGTRELSLFTTVALGGGDLFHLQNYADKPLDSVISFMKLLEKVGPMKMKWRPEYMTWTDYWCDLGLGGEQYYVGASVDIWADKNALKLSKEDLAKALSAKLKADPKFLLDKFLVHPPKPPTGTGGASGANTPPKITAADIGDLDIAKVKARAARAQGSARPTFREDPSGRTATVPIPDPPPKVNPNERHPAFPRKRRRSIIKVSSYRQADATAAGLASTPQARRATGSRGSSPRGRSLRCHAPGRCHGGYRHPTRGVRSDRAGDVHGRLPSAPPRLVCGTG